MEKPIKYRDFIDYQISRYPRVEDVELKGDYIKIWRSGALVFTSDDEGWTFYATWDDCYWDICEILDNLSEDKEIYDAFTVERTDLYHNPEILKAVSKEVHEFMMNLFDRVKNSR
ncbi:MAG: hypothetical protein MJ224_03215 [archaeon]|nr:hypothetical protein [archaeon]